MKKPVSARTTALKRAVYVKALTAARKAHPKGKVVVTQKKKPTAVHAKRVAAAKKAAATRARNATRKTALGGTCTWEAFGIRKPWYKRGPQHMSAVAARAGYVRGPAEAGGVVRVWLSLDSGCGYHAARVLAAGDDFVSLDLWGAAATLPRSAVLESYVPA
jgi:hypothetical protein